MGRGANHLTNLHQNLNPNPLSGPRAQESFVEMGLISAQIDVTIASGEEQDRIPKEKPRNNKNRRASHQARNSTDKNH